MTNDNPLALTIKRFGIDEIEAGSLQSTFQQFLTAAQVWDEKAKAITVTVGEDKEGIRKAREIRLELRQIRIAVEKRRVDLKAESLRRGQAIDAVANFIKSFIEPLEDHLQKQEDFVKLQIEAATRKRTEEREAKLAALGLAPNLYKTDTMTEEEFLAVLEREQKIREDFLKKQKEEAEEKERMRAENERLRKEASENTRKLNEEAAARRKIEEEARVQREALERRDKEARKKLVEEDIERQRIEREKQTAPDRQKLAELAGQLAAFEFPEVTSREAAHVIQHCVDDLAALSQFVKTKSVSL